MEVCLFVLAVLVCTNYQMYQINYFSRNEACIYCIHVTTRTYLSAWNYTVVNISQEISIPIKSFFRWGGGGGGGGGGWCLI